MESKSSVRKIISNPFIQTVAMYVSGGWILIELLEYFIAHFNLNEKIRIVLLIVLLCGLPVALIITWLVSRERKDITKSSAASKRSGKSSGIFRSPVYSLPSIVIVLLLIVFGIRYLNRSAKTKWAKEEALVQIEQLLNERNVIPAFDLLKKAEKYIAGDADFGRLADRVITKWAVLTDPPGADIYIREYADSTEEWEWLGQTPIDSVEIPNYTLYLMRIEKPQYEPVLATVPSNSDTVYRRLFKMDEVPEGMVYAYGFSGNFSKVAGTPEHGFFIDQYEVTNQQYKVFIEQGGYRNKDFWNHDFIKNGEDLSWEEAISEFTDKTGRPGPATWEASDYPEGQANYPVSGISWYEASAYAEYSGKSLPTVYHWESAAGFDFPYIWFYFTGQIKMKSNFFSEGPEATGKYQGISSFGAYDMAGNVREWCSNPTRTGHMIKGGAWNDAPYMFGNWSHLPSFNRSPKNGFRCVQYIEKDVFTTAQFDTVHFSEERNYAKEEPVSDQTFSIYLNQFLYDSIALEAVIEERDESSKDWVREKVSFNAAYGNERVIAYLYLPANSEPPYQTLIFFPGSYGVYHESIPESSWTNRFADYLLKNGRAVMFPVVKGTYERNDGLTLPMHGQNESHQYTEWLIYWGKDLSRTIDYLESRPDIAKDKISYYAHSWGGLLGGVFPAVENRFKASVLVVGGFTGKAYPEADVVNYISRVKCPVLMLNGKYDMTFPYETTVKPFYDLLGTAEKDKHLIVFETDHYVKKADIIRETLNFLDTYFGPVD
jgi:dienelactone hydrolase